MRNDPDDLFTPACHEDCNCWDCRVPVVEPWRADKEQRIALGLCQTLGCANWRRDEGSTCQVCRDRNKAAVTRYRARKAVANAT